MTDRTALIGLLRAAGCVFAEDEADLLLSAAASEAELLGWAERRMAGEPLEHVVGWVQFGGRKIRLVPGVFVPRRRTALMARVAVERLTAGDRLVELCCGAGAVASVVAASVPELQVWATDCDPLAVESARLNLPPERVLLGDLYQPLPPDLRGRIDVLVANAPYVPSESIALMPPEARFHEPAAALDGGPDGLHVLRRVLAEAPKWLTPTGSLLIEAGADQLQSLADFGREVGLTSAVHSDDELAAIVVEFIPAG